jgi:hypothetical protein
VLAFIARFQVDLVTIVTFPDSLLSANTTWIGALVQQNQLRHLEASQAATADPATLESLREQQRQLSRVLKSEEDAFITRADGVIFDTRGSV